VDEVPAPVGINQTGIPENPQVLGHRSRRDAEPVGQGTHAKRPLSQEPDDLHALLHGKRTKNAHHVLLIFHVHMF